STNYSSSHQANEKTPERVDLTHTFVVIAVIIIDSYRETIEIDRIL
ncbi:unnamed protein product, partial [Rotaria magnacalcarata]